MKAASKATPEAPSIEGRMWQHVAMLIAVVQFCIPRFEISTFNGLLLVFYHFFRQLMLIGFTSTLSRRTTSSVFTRVWPLTLLLIFGFTASSSFFLGGVISYPWLPHTVDRFAYMLGTVLFTSFL